jgi:hypothetical protein
MIRPLRQFADLDLIVHLSDQAKEMLQLVDEQLAMLEEQQQQQQRQERTSGGEAASGSAAYSFDPAAGGAAARRRLMASDGAGTILQGAQQQQQQRTMYVGGGGAEGTAQTAEAGRAGHQAAAVTFGPVKGSGGGPRGGSSGGLPVDGTNSLLGYGMALGPVSLTHTHTGDASLAPGLNSAATKADLFAGPTSSAYQQQQQVAPGDVGGRAQPPHNSVGSSQLQQSGAKNDRALSALRRAAAAAAAVGQAVAATAGGGAAEAAGGAVEGGEGCANPGLPTFAVPTDTVKWLTNVLRFKCSRPEPYYLDQVSRGLGLQ